MAARLKWTEGALQDLAAITTYIAADSPHYAVATADRIVELVEHLMTFPAAGRVVPEYADDRFRESIWGSYRIVYYIDEDGVAILAIVHGARLLKDYRGRLEPED